MEVSLSRVTYLFNSYIETDRYEEVFKKSNVMSEDIETFKNLTCAMSGKEFLDNNGPDYSLSDGDGHFSWFMIPEKFVEPMREHFDSEISRLTSELIKKGYTLVL